MSAMANGVTTSNSAVRNTPREFLPPTFTAVDERRFESEIRRIDTTLADERKNREKFETRIEKSVNDLRGEMNAQFEKVDARFEKVESDIKDLRNDMNARFEKVVDKMDSHFMWMMGFLVGAILIPIALQYFAK
jgi:peptidoglycan hydrolase CwlO-like protein